jgi:two-component system chemotaxis response regulator CheB
VPIRVLIVDDSVVIRRLVSDALASDPDIEVVATAANGLLALARLETTQVDLVTLDVEMPELDGLGTLKRIRQKDRRLPVIMFSTLTEQGARTTLEALSSGASDYVTKPANMGSVAESIEAVRSQLIPKIKALATAPARLPRAQLPARAAVRPVARTVPPPGPPRTVRPPEILVIGSSTGGPEALAQVLPKLPANFPLPVLIVQHMPPVFTRLFAERLDRNCALHVAEATDGQAIVPGTAFVAPGDFHLEVGPEAHRVTRLSQAAPENFCRPAVDVLFRSAARSYHGAVLALILTGMGSDGRNGVTAIRAEGGQTVVQDAETSVVWGMPGAVAEAGLADAIVPLPGIADALISRVRPPAARSARTLDRTGT